MDTTISDALKKAGIEMGDKINPYPEKEEENKRVTGKIIKVSTEEGWGFISSKEIKFTRIFFHWTSLKQDTLKFQDLKNGLRVEFTPVEVEGKGWRAIKIKVLSDEVKSENESTGTSTTS